MSSDDDGQTFDLRSYGRRRGRKLSPRQDRLMAELLPRVRVDLSQPATDVVGGLFQAPDGAGRPKAPPKVTWLEIGFGGGEHLIWQAAHHPHVALIGCEPFEDGIVKVLSAIDECGLGNIRVHPDDARAVLRWLPEASLDRAFVLFPDPWPKARHRKRRLVNTDTLKLLARALRPGGELRVATDIADYARTIMVAIQATPQFQWTAAAAADWRFRPDDWPETRYEQKAEREGRRSCYLRLVRLP